MSELHKFVLNLPQKLDLRSSNRYVALQNLSINQTWKNIKQQCKNNKLEITTPTWNDKFELCDSSDIQHYIKYITEKQEIRYSTLYQVYHRKTRSITTNRHIHIYINRINNRLVFKIKEGYKLELETSETM